MYRVTSWTEFRQEWRNAGGQTRFYESLSTARGVKTRLERRRPKGTFRIEQCPEEWTAVE